MAKKPSKTKAAKTGSSKASGKMPAFLMKSKAMGSAKKGKC